MPTQQTFTPTELQLLTDCALQLHLSLQEDPAEDTNGNDAILDTIRYLHAGGGPHRLNLPALLRYLEKQFDPADTAIGRARKIIADYHHQLRQEWANIIAVNETLSLKIPLTDGFLLCENSIDRLDKNTKGGVSVIKFILADSPPEPLSEKSIEATMRHALIAAAYPQHRPITLVFRWLAHGHDESIQLSEKNYRENLTRVKTRSRAWFNGKTMARPGLHCQHCQFQFNGCPIPHHKLPDTPTDTPSPAPPFKRKWIFSDSGSEE